MTTDWRVLAIAGAACIYAGNLLIGRAVNELERSQAVKRLERDSWTDAARERSPRRRRRRDDEADEADERKTDAVDPRE